MRNIRQNQALELQNAERSSKSGFGAPECKTFVKIWLSSTAPELLQSSSRPPPDLIQSSSRPPPELSSAPPALLQSSSRTVLLQSAKPSSKSGYGAPECRKIHKIGLSSTAPELLQSSSRAPPELLQSPSRPPPKLSSAPPELLQDCFAHKCETLVKIRLWSSRMPKIHQNQAVELQNAKHSLKSGFGAPECNTLVKISSICS